MLFDKKLKKISHFIEIAQTITNFWIIFGDFGLHSWENLGLFIILIWVYYKIHRSKVQSTFVLSNAQSNKQTCAWNFPARTLFSGQQ